MGDLCQNLSSVSEGRTVGRTDRQTEGQKLIRKTQVSSNKIDWLYYYYTVTLKYINQIKTIHLKKSLKNKTFAFFFTHMPFSLLFDKEKTDIFNR